MPLRQHNKFPNFYELDHPLVTHKITLLRDKNTGTKLFYELVREISLLLAYQATSRLPLEKHTIDTPLETVEASVLSGKKPVLLPVLRAGLGMVDAFRTLMPGARVGHIGLYRDEETLEPVEYYLKLPPSSEGRKVFVIDPMLATGGTGSAVVSQLKKRGIQDILYACIMAAPEGVAKLVQEAPGMPVFAACLDRELNNRGYILPGLGDAGDRIFGTG